MKNHVYIYIILLLLACKPGPKVADNNKNTIEISEKQPSDVIPFLDKWKILLGDGTPKNDLIGYKKDDFFYVVNKDSVNWVVFKTPNAGITSKTSKNTRTELHQKKYWTPKQGGKLSATLKVQHVSTTGDADKASSFSVVIGQIHSDDGHKNEPLKIYYKKFPGHQKGSVFFNYEINTKGDNAGRWDMSTPVWGHSFFKVSKHATDLPEDPKNGIALGETFSYEVLVDKGIMQLTFKCKGYPTKVFIKSLITSEFTTTKAIPAAVINTYSKKRVVGVEKAEAYTGELQFFKLGAYNQANPSSTNSKTYNGNIKQQYANGSYAEVWFKNVTVCANN